MIVIRCCAPPICFPVNTLMNFVVLSARFKFLTICGYHCINNPKFSNWPSDYMQHNWLSSTWGISSDLFPISVFCFYLSNFIDHTFSKFLSQKLHIDMIDGLLPFEFFNVELSVSVSLPSIRPNGCQPALWNSFGSSIVVFACWACRLHCRFLCGI